jgi:hypothetical protein
MHRPVLALSPRHERWLYGVGLGLLGSGVGWIITHYFFMQTGPFGRTPSALEPWWLRVHGAAMPLFLVLFGALLPGHIAVGWRLRRLHRSGALVLGAVALLAVTGWCLYYIGDDGPHAWIGVLHWSLGLAAAAALVAHALPPSRRRGVAAQSAALRSQDPAGPHSAPADAVAHRRR